MAKFNMELPADVLADFQKIHDNTESIFGAMTMAGAKYVLKTAEANAPMKVKGYVRKTRTYRTPSDGGINTKVYVTGYLPFSTPGRKYFYQKKSKDGYIYRTDKGVPAGFVAAMYEYGRSNAPFPKHPFFRKAFNKVQIEAAMLAAQKKASGGILE